MRDIVFTLLMLGLIPAAYRRPLIGMLAFSWLAYMRVQDLTWGFAKGMRWSFYVAIITMGGWVVNARRGRFFYPEIRCYMMIALLVLVGLGVVLSGSYAMQFLIKRYIEFAKNTFPRELRLDGLKVLVDCANGAAYKVAPTVLYELGADVVPLAVDPDGLNINLDCGATLPSSFSSTNLTPVRSATPCCTTVGLGRSLSRR